MIATTSWGPWTVIRPRSDLDLAGAPPVRQIVADLVRIGSSKLVLDLRDVGFVDSTGLGVLVGAARRLSALGGEIRLAGPRRSVDALLRSTGVAALFAIYASIEAAERDLDFQD